MPDSLSEKKLRRVLVVSALDGWSIALFAGACTLLSLAFAERVGVFVGTLVTAGGVIELLGNRRLKRGDAGGATALVGAQLVILGTIWVYAAVNLALFDEARLLGQLTAGGAGVSALLDQAGITTGDIRLLLRPAFFAFYLTVMLVTLFFQGGLALWYRNRRPAVRQALADRERVPPPPPMPRS